MIHTIENDKIALQIESLGAEMMSLKTKADECEYLWQGDPTYWSGRAFHLFPICGRLFQGVYTYQGSTYQMNIHGFLRASEMRVVSATSSTITFEFSDSEITRKQYPFGFVLQVEYRLCETSVTIGFQVKNTDDKALIFTLGGHPGFGLPLKQNEKFEDYYIEFSGKTPEKLLFSPNCFLTGETESFCLTEGQLPLSHDLFDHDAIFLQNMGTTIKLLSRKSEKGVAITCRDAKYFGLWHKPKSDAPYICLEPWLGIPSYEGQIDNLETKRDMVHLQPGDTFQSGFSITLY